MKNLPHVDVAIIGGGWTGLLMAKELGTRTSLSVVALERGGLRDKSEYAQDMDEVDYLLRFRMMQDLSKETFTLRHDTKKHALPIRQYGPFLIGTGVGGSGEHWSGTCYRGVPDGFKVLTRSIEKYGQKRLPENHSLQDWPVTYDEMEPYYYRMELLLGVSGKAGNLHGKLIEGGNPFEGRRTAEFPTPPMKRDYTSDLFYKSSKSLGYHPYPIPAANLTMRYTNPDGVTRGACFYCGFCHAFGCMVGAKAQPSTVLMPVITKHKSIQIRTGTVVTRILLDRPGNAGKAKGVVYRDQSGEEVFQPADLVILGTWTINNSRLLLLSGIGHPYNPDTGKGTLGRNLTHQVSRSAELMLDKPLNRFMGAGAAGIALSDFQGDSFDHKDVDFLRGGVVQCSSHAPLPISSFGSVPQSVKTRWGSDWKKAAVEYYDRVASVNFMAEQQPYKTNFMDLDPTYKDVYGDPLVRVTMNFEDNERKMMVYAAGKVTELAQAMGGKDIRVSPEPGNYDGRRYQGTHVHGGTIMGTSPEDSVVNAYQQHWDVPNLFVVGPSVFPQASQSSAPTLTVLATTARVADAVVDKYLKHPGLLA